MNRPNLSPTRSLGLILLLACAAHSAIYCSAAVGQTAAVKPALELDAPLEPFTPKHPRAEADQERLRAAALFAAGRTAFQRQDNTTALRLYQRAFRNAPGARPILTEIVPLAITLDRPAEAVRYAVAAREHRRVPNETLALEPVLLLRLGRYTSDDGDLANAVEFYEQAVTQLDRDASAIPRVQLWFEIGRLSFLAQDHAQAARYFSQVASALEHPTDAGLNEAAVKSVLGTAELTYQLFGESFLAAGDLDKAASAFEKSNELKADAGLLACNLARIAARQNRPAEALQKLQEYLDARLTVQGQLPYQLLEELLSQSGQADQLLPRLEQLRAADPRNQALASFLADQYGKAEKYNQAEPIYLRIVEASGNRLPIDAYRGLVAAYRHLHRPDSLLKTLASLVEKSGSLRLLSEDEKSTFGDAVTVQQVIEAAQAQRQTDAADLTYGARLATALLAVETKQFDLAGEYFELAIAADAQQAPDVLLTWGLEWFMAEKYADAANLFARGAAQAKQPAASAALNFYLAAALEMAGQTDAAVAAAHKAAADQPTSARVAGRAAWIEYHAKRYDDARKSYESLLQRFDAQHDSAEVREVLHDARLVLSNIAVLRENLPAAEEWLEQVLDEFPEDVGALNDLGYLWADQNKRLGRAFEMIAHAVTAEPRNKAYRDSLGWALFRLGRYGEAAAELRMAADTGEPDGTVLDHLGDALLASNDRAGALECWTRAVELLQKEPSGAKAQEVQMKIDNTRMKTEG